MLRNLKIGPKLMIGFFIIAILTGLVSFVSFVELTKLEEPLTLDIPQGLKEIDKTSHLDSLAQKIIYYDQVLTEAVRRYASTGDRKWKYRYKDMEPKLTAIIQEAVEKGDEEDAKDFQSVQTAKVSFTAMEYESIAAMDGGDKAKAVEILENAGYWQMKEEYKAGLKSYIERRGKKYGDTLEVTSAKVDTLVQAAHQRVQAAIRLLVMISAFSVFLALALGFLVARSILKPLTVLQAGTEIIGKGDLSHRIQIVGRDEINELANAFNEMAAKLKESYSGLEGKVRDKTRELANKVQEIERQNKVLEEAERRTMNALKDLEVAKGKIEKEKVEYEALLASIGDGMFATNQDGKIMMINGQAQAMLGYKIQEILGKSFDRIVRMEDDKGQPLAEERRPVAMALASGRKVTATAYYIRKDGTKFPVATTVSPIVLDQTAIGAIEIFRDITKEKEIDRMKSEFISTVSHELRTPLTVIREGVSLVLDGVLGQVTDEQNKFLRISLEDIDRLKRIIDNLLDVSKIEAGKVGLKREMVDIVGLIRGVADTFESRAKTKGLAIKVKAPEEPVAEIYLDRDKIIQVFTNLIGNAFKFTEKGHIEISVQDKGETIECYVGDTGRGISEEDLPKVFGKFEQFGREHGPGEKGTGLGLVISKGLVELHQGKIWVESKVNVGTRFIFTLPKYTARRLFKESVGNALREAMRQTIPLSVLIFSMKEPEIVRRNVGREKLRAVMNRLEELAVKCLRQQGDLIVKDTSTLLLTLSGTEREGALRVAERIQGVFGEYLAKEKMKPQVELMCNLANYPVNGQSEDELLDWLGYH